MSDLPTREYEWYAGIDVGFTGAVAWISADGVAAGSYDMPTIGTGKKQEMDLGGLEKVLANLPARSCAVGLEWPTTRPGEGAERSERFGRGKGILEAFLFLRGASYYKIAPNLWTGRLGIPGKDNPNSNRLAALMWNTYYPQHPGLIRGPRGGIRRGPLDALLIAHFLRTQTKGGMQSIVDRFGKDSDEAAAFVLSGGRRRCEV